MGIVDSSVVDASREEVFAGHERPGPIQRLLLPWQPVSVVSEAASLADGRAVLALPCGLRWTAQHASKGGGFLSDMVAEWEAATAAGLRVVTVRTGIVQTSRGVTQRLLRPVFAAGLGGRLGSGPQWLSWIDIDDPIDVHHRALVDPALAGPVNAVAPHPVRNADYTSTLARILHRPALIPVPGIGPALLLGAQGTRELATASQRVVPRRLIEAGHRLRRRTLEQRLRHQLGHIAGETP